jgi:vanillate O-demethylase monooxygenase subunit
MGGAAMYPRNFWYVAATAAEVRRLAIFRRVILDRPVAFYRKEDGKPVALEDRCCHRHMPLSAGRVKGSNVECGYHGFVYDATGACIHIPSQKQVPAEARVTAYPLAERYGYVWIWMGDPALADPKKIVSLPWMEDPAWRFKGEQLHVPGNYVLMVDNLLDLTHVQFVHPTTLGSAAVAASRMDTEVDGNVVRTTRWIENHPAPPFFQKAGGFAPDQNVDRWQIVEYHPPSFVLLDIGAAPSGTGAQQGNRSQGISLRNLNFITPETGRASHYFWSEGHNFLTDDPSVTELLVHGVHTAFDEDMAVIAAQQTNLEAFAGVPFADFNQDVANLRARRILEGIIASERDGRAAAE